MTYRVLITGSRDWSDLDSVVDAIKKAYLNAGCPSGFTIVHGGATGADALAQDVALAKGFINEPHPANWAKFGRKAGPQRNAYMVGLGAEICLAFVGYCSSPRCDEKAPHPSHGALGCAMFARQAGIPLDVTFLTKELHDHPRSATLRA